jgi:6-pyruvoyltetrahydropterin/6-carboxytetrahydropterin synthase
VWRRLDGKIPNSRLHRVRVYEMPDLFADFYGEFSHGEFTHGEFEEGKR